MMFKEYFKYIFQALSSSSQDEAIALSREAILKLPKHSFAYILLIIFYIKKNDIETAQYYCDELVKINPNFKFQASKNIEIALSAFILKHLINIKTPFFDTSLEEMLIKNPNSKEVYINASVAYLLNNDINNANRVIEDGLNLFPEDISLMYNKSSVLMKSSCLEDSWEFYEKRELIYEHHKMLLPDIEKFSFQKENINLLVYSSAGFGDTIFYSRYLELLKQKNINIFLYVQKPLKSLYEALGYNVISDLKAQKFDYQISFMSLGNLFKTSLDTIPFPNGYINIFEKKDLNIQKKKIGLVWKSGAKTNRSLELEKLTPLLKLDDVQFYSLQKEITESERKILNESNVVDLSGELVDFKETAKYIKALDYIVGCDTAVTNLSAAMGKETLLLLPYFCDFRWGISEFWTPWYESAKIFRQVIQDNWQKPIENLYEYIKRKK